MCVVLLRVPIVTLRQGGLLFSGTVCGSHAASVRLPPCAGPFLTTCIEGWSAQVLFAILIEAGSYVHPSASAIFIRKLPEHHAI